MQNHQFIQADSLEKLIGSESLILDVRTMMEHDEKHISFPHDHVELDKLEPQDFMLRRGLTKDDHLYILCASGNRAKQAADKFIKAGYPHVHVIEGGLGACEISGVPMKGYGAGAVKTGTGKTPVSLERQVRIAAGALVVIGAVLGLTVNPQFIWLSLFVGGGLISAGVTNRCGMALMLAKAPWNKTAGTAQAATTCSIGGNTGGTCAGGSATSGGTCAGGSAEPENKPVGKSCQ